MAGDGSRRRLAASSRLGRLRADRISRFMKRLTRRHRRSCSADHLPDHGALAGPIVEVDQHQMLPGAELEPPVAAASTTLRTPSVRSITSPSPSVEKRRCPVWVTR
ncbi:MAG: hypothetical protein ACRDL0_08430 [Thermoleophilaceae bacterium]